MGVNTPLHSALRHRDDVMGAIARNKRWAMLQIRATTISCYNSLILTPRYSLD